MVCVKCDKLAIYALRETNNAIYCKDHVPRVSVIDLKNKYCLDEGCKNIALYGLDDGKKNALYCYKHSKDNHINVVYKKCAQEHCTKEAKYGHEYLSNDLRNNKLDIS